MVEYEMADLGISQVLSQDHVNPAALLLRDGYFSCLRVFANLVFVFMTLVRFELGAKQMNSQCFEAIFSMLCSSAGRFVLVDFSAPFEKRNLFSQAVFSATHDIEHSLL